MYHRGMSKSIPVSMKVKNTKSEPYISQALHVYNVVPKYLLVQLHYLRAGDEKFWMRRKGGGG